MVYRFYLLFFVNLLFVAQIFLAIDLFEDFIIFSFGGQLYFTRAPSQNRLRNKKTPIVTLRLMEVRVGKVWRSYLTSVLEPEILPLYVVIDLYQKRWRIEDAFNLLRMARHSIVEKVKSQGKY